MLNIILKVVIINELENKGSITAKQNVGGIIGWLYEESLGYWGYGRDISYYIQIKASELKNSGNVSATSNAGGLIGYSYCDPNCVSECIDSSSSGIITAEYKVGGLFGWIDNEISIKNCSNQDSEVKASSYIYEDSNYYVYLGGYSGYGGYYYNCTNHINITYDEKGMYVGGISGYSLPHLESCTNNGNITATKSNYVGGLVGYISKFNGTNTYKNLYNNGMISANNYVGGIFGALKNVEYNGDSRDNFTATFSKLENSEAIYGMEYVGGIFGWLYEENLGYWGYGRDISYYIQVKAVELKNTGNLYGTTNVGGLFGYTYTDPNCVSDYLDCEVICKITVPYVTGKNIGEFIGKKENQFDETGDYTVSNVSFIETEVKK